MERLGPEAGVQVDWSVVDPGLEGGGISEGHSRRPRSRKSPHPHREDVAAVRAVVEDARGSGPAKAHRAHQAAGGAPLGEEPGRVGQEEPAGPLVPGRLQPDAQPRGEPGEELARHDAGIEKPLDRGDTPLDRRVDPFDIRQEPVEERSRFRIVAIGRREILGEIGEPGVVHPERP